MSDVSMMKGLTMVSVTGEVGGEELVFREQSGRVFRLYHCQDCCESVSIDDITGDLSSLVGSPLLVAEESSGVAPAHAEGEYVPDSETWTFYKFATMKGWVDVRWYGTSNGYYSETAYFEEETK